MGYIYKITNQINGKVYIGQTKCLPEDRWKQHLQSINHKQIYKKPLVLAFLKHGKENFVFEIIEMVDDSILSEKEKEYIKLYDSYKNGYNATLGGEGRYRKLDTPEKEIISLYLNIQSIEELSFKLNVCENSIRNILRRNHIPITRRKSVYKNNHIYKTKIIQYDLEGNFIKQFSSIKEAIYELNLHKKAASHIGKCCRGQKPTAYGFKWKYKHDVETQSVNS